MLKEIIQTGALAFVGALLISSYSQASPMVGHEITLDYGTNHKAGFSGGEFLLESTGGTVGDYAFTTFCLEVNEYFEPKSWNTNATYIIDSVADYAHKGGKFIDTQSLAKEGNPGDMDYISNASKWLMNEYLFNYDNLKGSSVEADQFAKDVQKALWFFEDEYETWTGNYLTKYVLEDLGYTKGYDSSFLSNVKVVNIVSYVNVGDGITEKKYHQSQLIANPVPEPATMLLFGSGLVGLAAIGRKKKIRK